MKQESLLRDLVKKGLSRSIAKKITDNFPEFKDIDQLVDFACTEEGKMKLEQLLALKSLSGLNRIIEKRKGDGVRPLGKGKSLSSAKTITELGEQDNPVAGTRRLPLGSGSDEEMEENIELMNEYCQKLMEQRKDLLYNTLAFNGVSGDILETIVAMFPWLQDFFGLFLMACSRIGAQMICSVLTSDGVLRLNELFFQEYGERPLLEKKKSGRRPKALHLAVVDAPC